MKQGKLDITSLRHFQVLVVVINMDNLDGIVHTCPSTVPVASTWHKAADSASPVGAGEHYSGGTQVSPQLVQRKDCFLRGRRRAIRPERCRRLHQAAGEPAAAPLPPLPPPAPPPGDTHTHGHSSSRLRHMTCSGHRRNRNLSGWMNDRTVYCVHWDFERFIPVLAAVKL